MDHTLDLKPGVSIVKPHQIDKLVLHPTFMILLVIRLHFARQSAATASDSSLTIPPIHSIGWIFMLSVQRIFRGPDIHIKPSGIAKQIDMYVTIIYVMSATIF